MWYLLAGFSDEGSMILDAPFFYKVISRIDCLAKMIFSIKAQLDFLRQQLFDL